MDVWSRFYGTFEAAFRLGAFFRCFSLVILFKSVCGRYKKEHKVSKKNTMFVFPTLAHINAHVASSMNGQKFPLHWVRHTSQAQFTLYFPISGINLMLAFQVFNFRKKSMRSWSHCNVCVFILAGGHVRASAGALAVHTALIPCLCVCVCLSVCPVTNSSLITPRIGTNFVSVDR